MSLAAIEERVRRSISFAQSDEGARWAWRVAVGVALVVLYVVGRHQWFIRDDWSFLLTRNQIRREVGWQEWLLVPQSGHWMTLPLLVYRGLESLFGIDSYWPYLIVNMALHIGVVFCVRALCRRIGIRLWTTTLVCSILLVFGAGWENIVFAIQITYLLSLLMFLAHVLLVDHEGPLDRRDVIGAAVGVIGVMSSGFGPFFAVGVGILLALRRRWSGLAVAVVPQALAMAWWWLEWGLDPRFDEHLPTNSLSAVPEFTTRGVVAVFDGLVGIGVLAGIALVAALAVALWMGQGWRRQTMLVAMWLTTVAMFVGVGTQRTGTEVAAASRYTYMGAMLLAPVFALAVDQLRRLSREAERVGVVLLVVALVLNTGRLHIRSSEWAIRAREEQNLLALIAGSGLAAEADPALTPVPFSPDITLRTLPWLVEQGAITPRAPANDAEVGRVRAALGLPVAAP